MTDKTFNLRVSQEQMDRWRAKAASAGQSVAGWIKELCDAQAGISKAADRPAQGGKPAPAKRKREEKDKPLGPTCIHGIKKGWRCWQCRGLAIIK